jgi:hypothetical protein
VIIDEKNSRLRCRAARGSRRGDHKRGRIHGMRPRGYDSLVS